MMSKLSWSLCALFIATTVLPTISFAQDPGSAREATAREATQQRERLADDARALTRNLTASPTNSNSQSVQSTVAAPRGFGIAQDPFAQSPELFYPGRTATVYGSHFRQGNQKLAQAYSEINQQLAELVKKIKTAESEEVKLELKAEAKLLLEEKYDAYLDHHETPLKQLEERLEKLRTEFDSRKQAKDDLVKLRLDTLWYDAIGLGWPEGQRGALSFPRPVARLNFGEAPTAPRAPVEIPRSRTLPGTGR